MPEPASWERSRGARLEHGAALHAAVRRGTERRRRHSGGGLDSRCTRGSGGRAGGDFRALTLCLLTMLVASAGHGAPPADVVPNPSFEMGTGGPAGWLLSGSDGQWLDTGAAHGQRAIQVSGAGGTTSYWRSAAVPFTPGGLYEVAFLARAAAGAGTPITGPVFANRDLGPIGSEWQEYRTVFLVPAELEPERSWLRFGQWHADGSVDYDRIELRPARPLYAQREGLRLGAGESLEGSSYRFALPLPHGSGNHSRPLVAHRCAFNTYRWCFGAGSFVTYCHQLRERRQTDARVAVTVSYHESGRLLVEASADGDSWRPVGEMAAAGTVTWDIPAALLPARQVWIRLRALAARPLGTESDPGSFQVSAYEYSATVDGTPLVAQGATHYVVLEDAPAGDIDARLVSLGDTVPGGTNHALLQLTNRGSSPQPVQAELVVSGGARALPFTSRPQVILPGATDTLSIPYQLPGAGDWDLRVQLAAGGTYASRIGLQLATLHETRYGERLPGSDSALALWWASSGWKVARHRPPPTAVGTGLRLSAAGGEAEAAQLVLRPDVTVEGLEVSITPLSGPAGAALSPTCFDLLQVGYVDIVQPSDPTGTAAPWPDPLLPLAGPLDLEAHANQPLWVRVRVPRQQPAGVYTGALVLRASGVERRVPLEVTVHGFDLPRQLRCSTAFGFSFHNVVAYQGLQTAAQKRQVLDLYLASFSAHHISPYDPAPLDPLQVRWEGTQPVLETAAWDRAMARGLDTLGFSSFRLPVQGLGSGTFHARQAPALAGFQEGTPEYAAMLPRYLQSLEQHLAARGWLDEAFVYWFDEPEPKDYDFVMHGFAKLRSHAPRLRRMLTEQVEPELVGGPDIWCPVTSAYQPGPAASRRAAGETMWWYICTGPKAPYAGLFIDHPGTALRVWLWQTWQHDVQGILIWQSNYWTSSAAYPEALQDPYADPMSWVSGYSTAANTRSPWGNGDGRFIYPPRAAAAGATTPVLAGPVESVRWEMLRDGLEDYEYFAMLEELLARRPDLDAATRARLTALLQVPTAVSADMTHYTVDPAPLEAHRRELARAIAALARP